MDTLRKVAASSAWRDCAFSPVLKATIDEWAKQQGSEEYREYFYWSKTLASKPFSLKTPPEQATFYISSAASVVYGIRMLRKSYILP
jgi:hypothetical protein